MNRPRRLMSAKHWLETQERRDSKYLVRSYSKRYGVDKLCAVKELTMLGIAISEQYVNQLQINVLQQQERARWKREEQEQQKWVEMYPDSDESFYFIVGYTSGGAPYGLTWEQYEQDLLDFSNDERETVTRDSPRCGPVDFDDIPI